MVSAVRTERLEGGMMVLRTLAFIGLTTVIIIVSMILIALWDMWRR
jgi:hypothetical protein